MAANGDDISIAVCMCMWDGVADGVFGVAGLVQRAWAADGGAAGGLSAHWRRGTVVGLAAGGGPISI